MNNPNTDHSKSSWLKYSKSNLPFLLIFLIQAPIFAYTYLKHDVLNYIPVWLVILIAVSSFYFIWIGLKKPNKLIRFVKAILICVLFSFAIIYIDLTISLIIGVFLDKG